MLTDKKKQFIFLKAAGLSQNEAALRTYKVKSRRNASVIANRLMNQTEVRNELAVLKQAFQQEFLDKAFKNWQLILNKIPAGKLNWSDWIKANKDTFEIAGLTTEEPITKITKKIEFIKQFYLDQKENKDTNNKE